MQGQRPHLRTVAATHATGVVAATRAPRPCSIEARRSSRSAPLAQSRRPPRFSARHASVLGTRRPSREHRRGGPTGTPKGAVSHAHPPRRSPAAARAPGAGKRRCARLSGVEHAGQRRQPRPGTARRHLAVHRARLARAHARADLRRAGNTTWRGSHRRRAVRRTSSASRFRDSRPAPIASPIRPSRRTISTPPAARSCSAREPWLRRPGPRIRRRPERASRRASRTSSTWCRSRS